MRLTRREFIKQFGIALASLVSARCVPPIEQPTPTYQVFCYARVTPTPTAASSPTPTCYEPMSSPTPSPTPVNQLTRQAQALTATVEAGGLPPEATRQAWAAISRERLRACWLRFDWLAQQTQQWDQKDQDMQPSQELLAEHRAALDDLVAASELPAPVAAQVQAAFDAAVYHVWRANAPITCYEPVVIDFKPTSSANLVAQAELLAQSDDLASDTVAQARAALERDVAFLNLTQEQVNALYQQIMNSRSPSQPVPTFEALDLDISPEAVAAAQFLIGLLLEE